MSFAENLSKLLDINDVSSYKLAKDIGVHTSTVTYWKEGKNPRLEHLILVADYFRCPIEQLIK